MRLPTPICNAVSAHWRGQPGLQVLEWSLARFWSPELPPVPPTLLDAMSPHGAGGRGIRWYAAGKDVLGYVPGVRGGYRIPTSAIPLTRLAAAGSDKGAPSVAVSA